MLSGEGREEKNERDGRRKRCERMELVLNVECGRDGGKERKGGKDRRGKRRGKDNEKRK